MYLAIIILPLLGSIASGFFGRKIGVAGAQVIIAVILITLLAVVAFFEVGYNIIPVSIEAFKWIDSEYLNVWWGFHFDSLTVSMIIQLVIVSSLSLTVGLGATVLSLNLHKLKFFNLFVPAGCPLGLLPLLVLIEFISYLARSIYLDTKILAILKKNKYKLLKTGLILIVICPATSYVGLNYFYFIFLTLNILFFLVYLPHVVLKSCPKTTGFGDIILGILTNISYLSLFYVISSILVYLTITEEFSMNYKSITPVFIFLGATLLIMIIFSIINNRKSTWSQIEDQLYKLWVIFNRQPVNFLIVCGLIFIFLIVFCSFIRSALGIQIFTNSWSLFYISIVSGLVAVKLVMVVTLLYLNNDIDKYYRNIALHPWTLLALIPSTGLYYFWVLPYIILLQNIFLGKLDILMNYFEHALTLITQKIYKSTFFRNLSGLYGTVYCSSSETENLFRELPFAGETKRLMLMEFKWTNPTRVEMANEYEVFRSKVAEHIPSSVQSQNSNLSTNQISVKNKGKSIILNNRNRKRTLSYSEGELSNVKRAKTLAYPISDITLNNPISDTTVSNPNSITHDDFTTRSVDIPVLHRKISNLLKNGEVKNNDYINNLPYASQDLRKDFYFVLKALGLTPFEQANRTKVLPLLNKLELYIDIIPNNPNSIVKDDFMKSEFNYDIVYKKIINHIEVSGVNIKDRISKLSFEPASLRLPFYARIKNLNLLKYDKTYANSIDILLKSLESHIIMVPNHQNSIVKSDFIDEFKYGVIYKKVCNFINEKGLKDKDRIGNLLYEPENIKADFYRKLEHLRIRNSQNVANTEIGTLKNILKSHEDFILFNNHYLMEVDIKEFNINTIHNKILKQLELGLISRNDSISKLRISPTPSLLKDLFYEQVATLDLVGNKYISNNKINQLINNLAKYIQMDYSSSYSINKHDFWDDNLKCDRILNKINNLIDSRSDVDKHSPLLKLDFEPSSLRGDFYVIIKRLHGKGRLPTNISTLQKILVQEVRNNSNSINKDDFINSNFNFKVIHNKIANLINLGEVSPEDRISSLQFYPDSLRPDFYTSIELLQLVNSKVSTTRIRGLMQAMSKFLEVPVNDPNSINRSDFSLEYGLDYKNIYIKVSNSIDNHQIKNRDTVSKLIFEPESLRSEFYATLHQLNLSNYQQHRATKIKNFKAMLEHKLLETYIQGISTNDNTISKHDINRSLNYRNLYIKISNLIRDNEIVGDDNLSKLLFRPSTLRSSFYAKIQQAGLTNYKEVSKTRIIYLQKRLSTEIIKESI